MDILIGFYYLSTPIVNLNIQNQKAKCQA